MSDRSTYWYILAVNAWYILAVNTWYILGVNTWYIIARKMTLPVRRNVKVFSVNTAVAGRQIPKPPRVHQLVQ